MLRKRGVKILLSVLFAFGAHELFRVATGKSNELLSLVAGLLFYFALNFGIFMFDWFNTKPRNESDEIIDGKS